MKEGKKKKEKKKKRNEKERRRRREREKKKNVKTVNERKENRKGQRKVERLLKGRKDNEGDLIAVVVIAIFRSLNLFIFLLLSILLTGQFLDLCFNLLFSSLSHIASLRSCLDAYEFGVSFLILGFGCAFFFFVGGVFVDLE